MMNKLRKILRLLDDAENDAKGQLKATLLCEKAAAAMIPPQNEAMAKCWGNLVVKRTAALDNTRVLSRKVWEIVEGHDE